MTNQEAHAIAEAVVDSLTATSAIRAAAAIAKARSLAQEHTPRNVQQPVKLVTIGTLGQAAVIRREA